MRNGDPGSLTALALATVAGPSVPCGPGREPPALAPTTLRVLVHQNPPFTDYMEHLQRGLPGAPPRA